MKFLNKHTRRLQAGPAKCLTCYFKVKLKQKNIFIRASLDLMGLFNKILGVLCYYFKGRGTTSRNEGQGQQQSLLKGHY